MDFFRKKGIQGYQPFQEEIFLVINFCGIAYNNYLLLKIDRLFDLTFIADLTKKLYYKNNAYSSINPTLFFYVQIINYLHRINSDHQLDEKTHLNLRCHCFYGFLIHKVSDNSSLKCICDHFTMELYQAIFDRLIEKLQKRTIFFNIISISFSSLTENRNKFKEDFLHILPKIGTNCLRVSIVNRNKSPAIFGSF